MAEHVIESALTHYNSVVRNKYKENWGSLLNFLEVEDTDFLSNQVLATDIYLDQKIINPVEKLVHHRNSTRSMEPQLRSDGRSAKTFMHSSLRRYLEEGDEMSNYVYKSPRKHIVMVSNRNLHKLPPQSSETPDVLKNDSFDYFG